MIFSNGFSTNRLCKQLVFAFAVTSLSTLSIANAGQSEAQDLKHKKSLVLQLKGSAFGEMRNYDTNGDGHNDGYGNCFDLTLYDPASGKQIGTGTDCLDVQYESGEGVNLTGTGFFNLRKGTLVVQGNTSVRPFFHPLPSRDGVNYTHLTGANGDGGVMYGTNKYEGATGKVRLSGQVDMSRVMSDNFIQFDCIFIVDFN